MNLIGIKNLNNENGAVLITGLVLLLILTLLGLVAMQSTTLQEKMANNLNNRNLAFQAAETALREGEAYLNSATLLPFNNSNGLYQPAPVGDPAHWQNTATWSGTASRTYSGVLNGVAATPRYIVEDLGPVQTSSSGSLTAGTALPEENRYRVTARGVGGVSSAVVILQSTYQR